MSMIALSLQILALLGPIAILRTYFPGPASYWLLLVASIALRMIFVSAFYHRYFSHRAYETSRAFQCIMAICGTTALQKGPLWWASHHRQYHDNTVEIIDSTSGIWGLISLHFGWLFATKNDHNSISDLRRFPELLWIDRLHFIPWISLTYLIYLFSGVHGLLWGAVVPQFYVWHFSSFINSNTHSWGTRRYQTGDSSVNNGWLSFLTLGEGWQNNHHADPQASQHGIAWYEVDFTFRCLQLLELLGLIWNLRPSRLVKKNSNLFSSNKANHPAAHKMDFSRNKIYEGTVTHSRYTPMMNQFSYKIFLMYVELDSATTDAAFDDFWFWSSKSNGWKTMPAFATFSMKEHLPKEAIFQLVLDEWRRVHSSSNNNASIALNGPVHQETSPEKLVDQKHALNCNSEPKLARVFLLTHFRYFGVRFNPVSYYYCYDENDILIAMVSEVHNTPWNEMCWYAHLADDSTRLADAKDTFSDLKLKKMHVSPFFKMNYNYRLKFTPPSDTLRVSWEMRRIEAIVIDGDKNTGPRDFFASMSLKSVPITQMSLTKILVTHPFMTMKVMLAIYWHAALLFFKGVPFVTHPDKLKVTPDNSR